MKLEHSKERMQERLGELKTLGDEIRVDLHLASMELRDEWKKLESRLPDERAITRLKDATKGALDTLVAELRAFRERLRSRNDGTTPPA
jgi:hypothetical protein